MVSSYSMVTIAINNPKLLIQIRLLQRVSLTLLRNVIDVNT